MKIVLRKTDWIPLKYELKVNIKDRLTFWSRNMLYLATLCSSKRLIKAFQTWRQCWHYVILSISWFNPIWQITVAFCLYFYLVSVFHSLFFFLLSGKKCGFLFMYISPKYKILFYAKSKLWNINMYNRVIKWEK